jgi:hypothetical protein
MGIAIECARMREMTKAIALYSAIALALVITSVEAKSPQQLGGEAPQTFAAWKASAAMAGEKGLPRLSDSKHAAVVRSVFDLEGLRTIAPVAAADTPHLLDACDSAKAIWKSYLLWSKDGAAPDIAKNETLFAPEITLGGAYVLTCMGYTAEAVRLFMRSLPPDQMTDVRKQGIEQARLGMMQMVLGLSQTLSQTNYSPEQKLMLAGALEDAAPKFAGLSAKGERSGLVDSLTSASTKVTEASVKALLLSAIAKVKAVD